MAPVPDLPPEPEPASRFEWERLIRRTRFAAKRSNYKFVALMIATYADGDGTNVFPGVARLVAVTELSAPTVKRALSWLREQGWIVKVKQGNRHANHCDEYRLTTPADLLKRDLLPPEELPAKSGDHLRGIRRSAG